MFDKFDFFGIEFQGKKTYYFYYLFKGLYTYKIRTAIVESRINISHTLY